MTFRKSIFILFASTLINACLSNTQNKKYSITTYFTSFDSSSNSMGKEGQKFKYAYEEYNADSNLIYQELYATPDNFGDVWGKLFERKKNFYSHRQKEKTEEEFGLGYPPAEIGRRKGKRTYTYEYEKGQLARVLLNGKPVEEYMYDLGNQVEKRIINGLNIPEYYHFSFANGLKVKAQYFVADTMAGVDTFLYNVDKHLIEKYSYDGNGDKVGHTLILRNAKEQAIEEKWRKPYKDWRVSDDGKIIEDEFYQVNKYYYNNKGQMLKTEFYDIGRLMTVYEFEYD